MTQEIDQAIAAWNLTATNPVKHIHIYESAWGKGFAGLWAALIVYLVITFLDTRHSIPFSSIVVMLYGAAYIGKVCYYNFLRKKAGNEPSVL